MYGPVAQPDFHQRSTLKETLLDPKMPLGLIRPT
jgi:hypothetical protein